MQQNFIAQSGDPTGTGTGGDSIYGYIPIPCAECGLKKGKGGMALLMVVPITKVLMMWMSIAAQNYVWGASAFL